MQPFDRLIYYRNDLKQVKERKIDRRNLIIGVNEDLRGGHEEKADYHSYYILTYHVCSYSNGNIR